MIKARELLKDALEILQDIGEEDLMMKEEDLMMKIDAYLAKPEPEPVAWTGSGSLEAIKNDRSGFILGRKYKSHPIPLYAEPPARKPLTEQEILDCSEKTWHKFDLDNDVNFKGLVNIVREIEKTHGIK